MAYTLTINVVLPTTSTGLTLGAQLVDTAGANVGAEVATGFVEIGSGNYMWTYAAFPDNFRGGVKFQLSGGGALQAFAAINPVDAELELDLADGIESGYTLRKALKLIAAVLCGKVSGGPRTPVFRSMDDSANRVSSTADPSGNRTAVTLNP